MHVRRRIRGSSSNMEIFIENTVSATAYVVTGALAMITAEVPVHNEEEFPIEFSLYNQVLDPNGQIVTTTETRYKLGPRRQEVIEDEMLRVKDPVNELTGYRMRALLTVDGQVLHTVEVEIEKE